MVANFVYIVLPTKNGIMKTLNGYKNTIVITNRKLAGNQLLPQLQKILRLHPQALILRETDLPDEEYEIFAKETMRMCEKENVLCFLHSRIAMAHKIGCRNIHLPLMLLTKTMSLDAAHPNANLLQHGFERISVSCHGMEDVKAAVAWGATQIVLGTVFATESKKGVEGRGLGFVREICNACPVPVYAIGGITLDNLPSVLEAGAEGGCMMSGFMKL